MDAQIETAHHEIPRWALPAVFLLLLAWVEVAGKAYGDRRTWYLLALGLSNMFFPFLVVHSDMAPWLTVCVLAFALRPGWAFAAMDCEESRPDLALYCPSVVFIGFGIAAVISTVVLDGEIPGSASEGNPFVASLLFGMTLSLLLCGRAAGARVIWYDQASQALPNGLVNVADVRPVKGVGLWGGDVRDQGPGVAEGDAAAVGDARLSCDVWDQVGPDIV